jgi:hypothetical protein
MGNIRYIYADILSSTLRLQLVRLQRFLTARAAPRCTELYANTADAAEVDTKGRAGRCGALGASPPAYSQSCVAR